MRSKVPPEVSNAIPAAGFIRDYVEYASRCTDAPEAYHVGCAAAVVSTLMADKVHLISGSVHENLNLWVMISGRSSQERKSTSVRLAKELISKTAPQRLAPTSGSMEGLLERLAEEPCSIFVASELAALLDQMEASYWRQGRSLLMDIYDGGEEYVRQLRNQEPIVIERPRISVLAASSASLLEQTTRSTDWTGGFLARFLVIYDERKRFMPRRQDDPRARQALIESLHGIMDYPRRYVQVTDEAAREHIRFTSWLEHVIKRSPEYLHGLISRLSDHILRLAGIYALSSGVRTDLGRTHMKRAIAFGKIALRSINMIADRVAREPRMKIRARILSLLGKAPEGLYERDILRGLSKIKREVDPIIESLVAEELITITVQGPRRRSLIQLTEHSDRRRRGKKGKRKPSTVIPMYPPDYDRNDND